LAHASSELGLGHLRGDIVSRVGFIRSIAIVKTFHPTTLHLAVFAERDKVITDSSFTKCCEGATRAYNQSSIVS
jgi:hypothetical protein